MVILTALNTGRPRLFQVRREIPYGSPGNALKLDVAQKNVSSTVIQLGSGWNPGRTGLVYEEFVAAPTASKAAETGCILADAVRRGTFDNGSFFSRPGGSRLLSCIKHIRGYC